MFLICISYVLFQLISSERFGMFLNLGYITSSCVTDNYLLLIRFHKPTE